jgi:two-component system LytT family response regulator
MLRVILIDDEQLSRQRLREMLGDIDSVEVVGEAASVSEATALIAEKKPDALFLDIMMPEKDGFSLLSAMKKCPPVVFVTAHAEYAARAFDFEAVDYLLKPVRPARLGAALKRLRSATGQTQAGPAYGQNDRICLRTPERTLVAPLGDLLSLEAEGDFTRVTVSGESPLLICRPLGQFEEELPLPPFQRIDRSLIINLDRIHSLEIKPERGARVFLQGLTAPIELGRSALRRLREALSSLGNQP